MKGLERRSIKRAKIHTNRNKKEAKRERKANRDWDESWKIK
jgi:hypothetical protein